MAAVAAVLMVAVGCSPGAEVPRGLGDPRALSGEGVCGLVDVGELELAVNASIRDVSSAGPSQPEAAGGADERELSSDSDLPGDGELPDDADLRGGGPPGDVELPDEAAAAASTRSGRGARPLLAGMDMCHAGSPDAGAVWGVVTDDAEATFERYSDWHDDYTTSTRVEGHPAVWDRQLRTLVVHADEVTFALSLSADNPVLVEDEDEDRYLKERAEEITSRALRRMR